MNDELLSDDTFDLPFKNPFKRENETQTQFNKRCDRSTMGLKRDMFHLFGSGGNYINYYQKGYHIRNGKVGKRAGNGLR